MPVDDSRSRRTNLSAAKRELLERRRRGEARIPKDLIGRRADRGAPPLSFAQQRLWLIDQIDPENIAYTLPIGFRLTGRIDITSLRRAFEEVVTRHEVLRTRFRAVDGVAAQIIAPTGSMSLPLIDLLDCPAERLEAEFKRVCGEITELPFDLSRGPLLRSCLVRLGDEDCGLILTMHHIISDDRSINILINEVVSFYKHISA